MRIFASLVAAAMALCLGSVVAHAEKRVALVIGNSAYTNLPGEQQLKTAVKDARAVADALRRLGFEVIKGENLSHAAFNARFDELTRKLSPGDTALVYFAGHGISLSGGNYLLPSDVPEVKGGQEGLLARSSLGEDDMVTELQARGVRVVAVVLDACRNNPFKRSNQPLIGAERGLTGIEPKRPSSGVFKLYSAGIGQSALDQLNKSDRNPNSVFTRVLVSELAKPGLDLTTLGKEVGKEVQRLALTADHEQQPASYDKDAGSVYLAAAPSGDLRPVQPSEAAPSSGSDAAEVAKTAARDAEIRAILEEFGQRYDDSLFSSQVPAGGTELPNTPVAATTAPHPDGIEGKTLHDAALRGEPAAFYEIGKRYYEGKVVPRDYLGAVEWFKRADQAGLVPAAFRLGVLHEKGWGVKKDVTQAKKYYLKAALRGNAAAMHNLAVLDFSTLNPISAVEWYTKAANCGMRDSQFNLAMLYYKGAGVKQDLAESYKWFSLAAAAGDREATSRRDDVANRLNDEAKAAAERAIRDFVVEKEPDDATTVPVPAGGWDTPVAQTPDPGAAGAASAAEPDGAATNTRESGANVPEAENLPGSIGGARLRAAAERGEPAAAYEVGRRYYEGKIVPQNYREAAAWFKKAEEAGLVPAAFQLGVIYEKGQGIERNSSTAMLYYRKAAEAGNAAAMQNVAAFAARWGKYDSAVPWFTKAANRGESDSQAQLGMIYAKGSGVKKNLVESYKWLSLAAASGHNMAIYWRAGVAARMNNQEKAYAEQAIRNFVVEKEPDAAISVPVPLGGWDSPAVKTPEPGAAGAAPQPDVTPLDSSKSGANVPERETLPDAIGGKRLRAAAERGEPAAAYEIGLRYYEGRVVPQNYGEAAVWFKRADEAGVVPAAFRLGVLSEKGQGVEKNVTDAIMYYRKAAERGNAAAMHNLGVLEADKGDHVNAMQWFIKAANRGVKDSQFNLAVLYYNGGRVPQDLPQSYKWFSLAAAGGDSGAIVRRDEVAMRLSDEAKASAEQEIRKFVVEPLPDEAINVPAPIGGWDAPVVKTLRSGGL